MSNHAPAIPADFGLTQLQYYATLPTLSGAIAQGGTGYVTGATVQKNTQLGQDQTTVLFAEPGALGSFDQDAFEATYTTSLTDCLQAMATYTGIPLAELQSQVAILRIWVFASVANPALAYSEQEAMTYPAS